MAGERHFSLSGKLALLVAADVAVTAGVAALVSRLLPQPGLVLALSLVAGLVFGLWSLGRGLSSVTRTLQALTDGVRGFRDQDFSLRLSVRRHDEVVLVFALFMDIG